MRWLASIGVARRKSVVLAYGNIRLLYPVLVHVTEHKTKGAVCIGPPAFVSGLDMLPRLVTCLCEAWRAQKAEEGSDDCGEQGFRPAHHTTGVNIHRVLFLSSN